MSRKTFERRDFIRCLLGGIPILAFDWSSFPMGSNSQTNPDQYDAIIIGSGLGGLSCAAAFARQGFRPLVLEKHYSPGGYATTFRRPGGFEFDVSLHSTSVSDRDGIHNLIPGFPEITDVEFEPHPNLYRSVFPEHDLQIPQRDIEEYSNVLASHFPEEKEGISGIIDDMQGIVRELGKIQHSDDPIDMTRFQVEFPNLFSCYSNTWGALVDKRIADPKLKAIISTQWSYYGLPPSRVASYYFALPAINYLRRGGFYPRGKSQKISNALVDYIEENGGKVILGSRVERILTNGETAYGVRTEQGDEYRGKVIVSNVNAFDTFGHMLDKGEYLSDYTSGFNELSVSLSSFQIFLGLKEDLISKTGIPDSEIFCESGYDLDASYQASKRGDVNACGFTLTLYDNIYKGYSPQGKNALNIFSLQGYSHWEKFAADYFNGSKAAYIREKERMAEILIKRVEKTLLPGLSKAIEIKEIGTPLTNVRYTGNYRGAIYGWDQTLNNSGPRRVPHTTPVKNLYLSGAWTSPGHGYGGVLWSGLECFSEIMQEWA